jgi:hypothetical protein
MPNFKENCEKNTSEMTEKHKKLLKIRSTSDLDVKQKVKFHFHFQCSFFFLVPSNLTGTA